MKDIRLSRAIKQLRLLRRARAELAGCFGAGAVKVSGLLKSSGASMVVSGRFKGQDAVFKKISEPEAGTVVSAACEALTYLQQNLNPPYFANRCLATAPAQGWIVLSAVPGPHVGAALTAADEAETARILRLTGGWLRACCELRSENRVLRPVRFLQRLPAPDEDIMTPADRDLADSLLAYLHECAGSLDGRAVLHGVAHGDFAPVNLHYSDGQIHAVDIQGAHWFPVPRMAARFLVTKDMYRDLPRTGLWQGLDCAEIDPYLSAADLDSSDPALRFFVAEQFAVRFLGSYARAQRRPNIQRRISALLEAAHAAREREVVR